MQPSWSSLFRAALIINEVQLDSPRFHIIRYETQRFNITDLIERFDGQPSSPDSKPTLFSYRTSDSKTVGLASTTGYST